MNGSLMEREKQTGKAVSAPQKRSATSGAFFWLSVFYVVYCVRPEDWIPGLSHVPMAKIAGIFAFLGLLASLGRTQRKFNSLPREAF